MKTCSEEIVGHEIDTGSTTLNSVWMFQIVWGTISFILGLSGNVFVLYATIVHNAIKLDKMSVWIIKNLAVADICNCVLFLLPTLLTQYGKLTGTIVFGETFYAVMACYVYSFFVSSVFLVNFLSINKFMRCMFPLRNLNCSRLQKFCVTLFTVIVSSLPILWFAYSILDGFQCLRNEWRLINYLGAGRISHTRVNKAAEFIKARGGAHPKKTKKNQSLHQNWQIGIGFFWFFLVFFGFLKFPNWHWFFLVFFGFFWFF